MRVSAADWRMQTRGYSWDTQTLADVDAKVDAKDTHLYY
jgi:hypothetical protein